MFFSKGIPNENEYKMMLAYMHTGNGENQLLSSGNSDTKY